MNKKAKEGNFLTDIWYLAMPGRALKKGQMKNLVILDRCVLLGRDNEGSVFCLRDLCPHRGMPLSQGQFDGKELECCYHGWRFSCEGTCVAIPSLGPDTDFKTEKVKVFRYAVKEQNGNIWVYIPDTYRMEYNIHENALLSLPIDQEKSFRFVSSHELPCDVDNAVTGLIDPAHVPHVHASWWWRSKKKQKKKQKNFVPTGLGFKMVAHKPGENAKVYRLFKKKIEIEITFSIPGIRVEHIRYGKTGEIVLLTALTPITEQSTMLHQFFYSNIRVLNALFPLLKMVGNVFIGQDVEILNKQKEGLRQHPPQMLVGEADQQARWYFKLKESYREAARKQEPVNHPLKEKTRLTWYS